MTLDQETRSQLLETLDRFVKERLIPAERAMAETGEMDQSILSEMRELGLYGISIPEEYGGLGLCLADEVEIAMCIGQAAPAFRSAFGTNVGIGSQAILIDGTDEQRRKYLPRLANGELVGSFCLTESSSGSDAGSLKATAKKDGDHYILNGTKRYITNAPTAGLFTVMARTDKTTTDGRGVSAFLVEADTPGVSVGKPEKKMGQQGAPVADVIFENCQIPAENLIGGKENVGFKTAMKVLDKGRIHISAVCTGLAGRILRDAVTYAKEREQFGEPIANFQLIQAMIADSETEIYAAKCMIRDVAKAKDRGENTKRRASCTKLFASEAVGRIADRAVQILGGAGYISEYGIEQLYRDARLFRIYEGTSQIQQLIIAKDVISSY
ncbi:acyl-CoA dehydrogenase family protein [Kordiimonas sp. SCSIO 12603]|uniref:acyl-CoA dehydrogenase family protein n=1 Tax=Kordiimonas sp. SCSIO 12603 TaxID=2829596 RepID=UPI0021072964|nr:acyl-CoA dehydrogenase family protein [Kordiimonas sp. SCSIO 12603]UTW57804.1 acyl-CoA dehydrogenase family protein [Kordiimonas sp. SCSIO 12603]